ncbi:MAG: hypothetical protein J6P13_06715 [Kiritimatiellae bacterium]|nr:hypothetical protein [Kiritimatiellia bacterium]
MTHYFKPVVDRAEALPLGKPGVSATGLAGWGSCDDRRRTPGQRRLRLVAGGRVVGDATI